MTTEQEPRVRLTSESRGKDLKGIQRRFWSGQLDSNQRPAVPKTAALPGCAIPRLSGKRRRYTLKPLPARRLSTASMAVKQRMRHLVAGRDPVFFCRTGDHLKHPLRHPPCGED